RRCLPKSPICIKTSCLKILPVAMCTTPDEGSERDLRLSVKGQVAGVPTLRPMAQQHRVETRHENRTGGFVERVGLIYGVRIKKSRCFPGSPEFSPRVRCHRACLSAARRIPRAQRET